MGEPEAAAPQAAPPWDRVRVLGLATDLASRRAALGVPASAWTGVGRDGARLLWGSCQGSRPSPYEVVADLEGPGFACSCPSRKRPCKHALALLLHWLSGQVPAADPPAFALRGVATGAEATEATPTPPGTLADPEAAAARAAARAQRVSDGLDELGIWIGDQIRSGLAGLERAGYGYVDAVAARMIDAQAPGVAGMLRAIPGELAREGWPERVLEQLAALHLLILAHRRLAELPPELAATVRSRVGYPVARSDVLQRPGVFDDWLAVGQVDTVEYRLETRRVWLWGRQSRRWALWLTFAPPGQAPDTTVTAGMRLRGSLHFYPGAGQYRVAVGELAPPPPGTRAWTEPDGPGPESIVQARVRYAELLAADPWASRMPAVLQVAPVPPVGGGPWRLRDRGGHCRDVVGLAGAEPWPLVAQARGRELPVMVEWTRGGVRPLAVLTPGSTSTVQRAA